MYKFCMISQYRSHKSLSLFSLSLFFTFLFFFKCDLTNQRYKSLIPYHWTIILSQHMIHLRILRSIHMYILHNKLIAIFKWCTTRTYCLRYRLCCNCSIKKAMLKLILCPTAWFLSWRRCFLGRNNAGGSGHTFRTSCYFTRLLCGLSRTSRFCSWNSSGTIITLLLAVLL